MGFFDWKQILGRNWAWYSHQKLYDMVKTEATGASAVSDADQTWMDFNTLMAESRQNIDQLLREAGASWEGVAADAMAAGVMPLAQWTDDASTAGDASGGSVQTVGSSFGFIANAMPEPVQVTSTANTDAWGIPAAYTHLFGGQTDQDRQEHEAQQAKQHAVELMTSYSTDAGSAVDSVGVFVPPQDVTVNVAPPQQQTPGAVEYTGGEIHGPRGPVEPLTPTPRNPDVPASGDGDPDSPTTTPGQAPGPVGGPPPPTGPQATPTPPSGPPTHGPVVNPVLPVDTKRPDLPVTGFDPVTGRPIDPRTGRPIEVTTGRRGAGGPRGGPGAGPVGGGPADGEPVRGRGGLSGSSPLASEGHAGGRGAVPTGRAGAAHGPMAPLVPGAGARREEDQERRSPDYLRNYHDEFWDTSPAVAPPVIGEDDPPVPAADKDKEG